MNQKALSDVIRASSGKLARCPVVTGFDGFVDEMILVVDERQTQTQMRHIARIADFGAKISASAGHSTLREIVIDRLDPGGCAVNMGEGLASLGIPVSTFATLGEPIHRAFADYGKRAQLVSWGKEPGRTLAFEFEDGKVMFSAVTQLADFRPENLAAYLSDGAFSSACSQASMIALTDWTLYPFMTECWAFLVDKVFSKLPQPTPFYFDLVDPSSRSDEDIKNMLTVLRQFEQFGPVTLGLNQNEASILRRITGGNSGKINGENEALQAAVHLSNTLGITSVLVHASRYAVGTRGSATAVVPAAHCAKPKKSTGAGDRFNAGYVAGQLLELDLASCLRLGCANAGYFVRHAESPGLANLAAFLENSDQGSDPA